MLDEIFCQSLESRLCDIFENLDDESVKGFWCDGVLLLEADKYYSQKFVNDNRQVKLQAFVGKNGQALYNLTLKLGKKALSRYARNLSIAECIPMDDFEACFKVDTSRKEIEIQLD